MHLTVTDYIIWLAGPILQFGVLVTMFRRGLYKDYPYFFNYTILQVVSEPILYGLHRYSDTLYFYTYYVNIALSVLISFAVLQEIFKDAFKPYEALRDLSVILFRWSALVVLLVGVMWAINARGKTDDGVIGAIMLGERAVRLMQCGLVFFLLLFSEYLGISRRSLLFGISWASASLPPSTCWLSQEWRRVVEFCRRWFCATSTAVLSSSRVLSGWVTRW